MVKTLLAQTVRAKLMKLRAEQGDSTPVSELWTQKRLAEQLGMDAATLSQKLSGARPVSLSEGKKLADFLGFDLNSFYQLYTLDRA